MGRLSWKLAVPWLVVAALVGALLALNTGSDQRIGSDQTDDQSTSSDQGAGSDQQEPTKPRTIADLLDDCSPFEAFDGVQTLEFDAAARTIMLKEAVGDERKKGALFAKHPQITPGTWTADEATRAVVVNVASIPTTYTLVVPPSQTLCILVHGPIGSADLQASWFGTRPDTSGRSND